MSKPKFTPRPWTVEYDGDGCTVTFDEGPVVYDTTGEDDESLADIAELEANARLISAAPDALAVIDHAISELMRAYKMTSKLETEDHKFGGALNELVMRLNEDLKTVRAKATGGAE